MLTTYLVILFGVATVCGFLIVISSRRAKQFADISRSLDNDVATVLRRKEQIDVAVVEELQRGAPIDQTISDYQEKRTRLACHRPHHRALVLGRRRSGTLA